jgi:hypothetical protein
VAKDLGQARIVGKQESEVIMGREIPFQNVLRNLKDDRYLGKITDADYSNLAMRLFDEDKFADNLGVSKQFLRDIGLVVLTEQCGWRLPTQPTVEALLASQDKIEQEKQRLTALWRTRFG